MQTRVYDLCSDLVLYAHWTEVEDPAQELVVNVMEDQQDWVTGDWTVSLREAIEYAAEHPDVVDATGQRRITFDPRVFAPGSSNVVWVTREIVLTQDPFPPDKPLVIEGPSTAQVWLNGSDTRNRFLSLTNGANWVTLRNLAFRRFETPQGLDQNGGVFQLKNGVSAIFAENCRFEMNFAEWSGSVAYLDGQSVRFEADRCSFVANSSVYGVIYGEKSQSHVISIRGCTFQMNTVYGGPRGLRDLIRSSSPACQLLQNTFVTGPDQPVHQVCSDAKGQGNLCVRTTPTDGELEYEADQVLVDGFTPKTAVVDGVLQTFFPIKKGSPADGTGVRIEGRTHDIVGKPIPAADAKVNGISLGSWNQDWEKASTEVTITEDIVDDTDGETSFREAIATSASDACWTNALGQRAVTFAPALWDQAGDALVIPGRDRAFLVANPTNAPLVVTGPDTGTKGLVFEGAGSDHVLFEGGEGTGLVLRNLTARGGHGGRGGALDFSATNCHFCVSNCLFTANSATDGIVCGRGDVLNCSFLDNSGCGDVFIHGLLIESTLLGDRPSRIYEEMGAFALGCTVPAGLEVAGNRIYGCITRAEELGGVQLQSYKVGTVTQYAYPIAWGSRFAGKGYFLWHNDAWTALAYSKLIDGRDKVYVCRPAGTVANILHDVDVTGRRISPAAGDNRNSAGSYAVPCEPASLVVDSVAVYDDDGYENFNDGVVTLRDAIFYAHERPKLAGSNGPGYRITFDPQLYKDATNGLSLLAPRPYTVDGTNFSSKTPLTIVGDPDARPWPGIDQFQAERLFTVSNNATLTLANLALRGNGIGQAPSFDAQALAPTDAGRRLAPRTIYAVWTDTTIEATVPGQSGLVVEGTDAEPSVIYLYNGAKLTVKGAPAQGPVGGGAGIELTGGHHLLVCGIGSVVATGGDAAPGSVGEAGSPCTVEASAVHESDGLIISFNALASWSVRGGNGGTGGVGGGGAGAGIGTPGAIGGTGGTGGTGAFSTKSNVEMTLSKDLTAESAAGPSGSLGNLGGVHPTSVGTLSIVGANGDCSVSATGGRSAEEYGRASSGADSPVEQKRVKNPVWKDDITAFYACARGGEGGGGGMGGATGVNFGSGGTGGTGGTGGAGGGYSVNGETNEPPGYPFRDDDPRFPEGRPVWGKVRSYRSQAEDLVGGSNAWTKFTAEDAMAEWPFVEPVFLKHPTTGGAATSGACVSLARGRLAMENCQVSDFRRDFGGMLVLDANSGATFSRTVFSGNSAAQEGGVVYGRGGSLAFTNCVFDANTAILGGVLSGSNTTVLVEGCTISSNTASTGGAIYLKGRSDLNPTRLTLANCSVLDNAAVSLGGAVWGEHVDTVLAGTTFRGNTVATANGNGAGLYLQGKGSSAALANVLLVGNGVKGTSTELNFAASDLVTNSAPAKIRVYSSKIGAGFPFPLTAGKDDGTRAYIGSAYADVSRTYLDSNYTRRRDTVDVDGVLQRFERTQPTAESIGNPLTGWTIRHNADWSSVTVASNATTQTSWLLRGTANDAKTELATDITRRGFKNPEPQMGSFWMVQDRPTLEVDTLKDAIDPWDAQVSLHEILSQIMDESSPWATNLVKNRRFDITFKDGLEGTILQTIDPVKITGLTGCVFTVTGPTNRTIVIDGQDKWRAFAVGVSNTLHISNLTMSNCLGRTYGSYSADGGGILNEGNLVVSNCAFYACAAGRYRTDPMGDGGAIHTTRNAKTLVKNATFGDNVAAHGGALAVADGGQLTVLHSTFDGNVAQGGGSVYDANGGAVLVKGATADALLANCTFTANEVVQGSSAAPGHAVAVDGPGAKAPTAKIVNGILCGNGTNDLQATRGSQVRIAYTAFGARLPGVDTNIWDDISITSNATTMAVFAHLDAEGRPLARRLVHDGTRHRVYPLLEGADFDAVYVRGDAMWTKAAWSVNGSSSWKLLRGSSALAAGCVKMTLDQVGTTYDQPKIGAVVAAEERGEDDPPAPVDPAKPGAIWTPTVDALVAAIKEVAAFDPAVTFATNAAVNGTVSFVDGIAFAESEEGARKTLEIHGPMTFDAQGQSRFFTVPNGLTLKLYDITFVNGKVEGEDESGAGGAILVLDGGTLYASNCTFRANAATYGGAVAQLGDTSSTTFIDCTFDENVAEDPEYGNAIYHEGTSELVLEGTSIDAADIMDYPDVVLTTPVIASIDVVDGEVAIWPRDPQPNVYYGLAWTTDLAAGFSAETITEWVRSDGHGVLPKPLSAPATGDRCFYRIFVRGEKP